MSRRVLVTGGASGLGLALTELPVGDFTSTARNRPSRSWPITSAHPLQPYRTNCPVSVRNAPLFWRSHQATAGWFRQRLQDFDQRGGFGSVVLPGDALRGLVAKEAGCSGGLRFIGPPPPLRQEPRCSDVRGLAALVPVGVRQTDESGQHLGWDTATSSSSRANFR